VGEAGWTWGSAGAAEAEIFSVLSVFVDMWIE